MRLLVGQGKGLASPEPGEIQQNDTAGFTQRLLPGVIPHSHPDPCPTPPTPASTHRSGNKEENLKWLLIVTSNNLFTESLLSVLAPLSFASVERNDFLRGHNRGSVEFEEKIATWFFGAL